MFKQVTTPQTKLIDTTKRLGVSGIDKMQGTTRVIYDSVPVSAGSTLSFFRDANARQFPLTNMQKGNKLEVGESLVIQFINFSFFGIREGKYEDFGSAMDVLTDLAAFGMSELNILIANSQVIKPIPLSQFLPQFNKNAYNENSEVFNFNTLLVIPPLVEFEVNVKIPSQGLAVPNPEYFMRCTLEGVGSIVAPRQTL